MADLCETRPCFVSIQDRHKDNLCRKNLKRGFEGTFSSEESI